MSSKTKIVVLHMKELIYTIVFAALAVVLILLLVIMFRPAKDEEKKNSKYVAGVYTASADINNTTFEVEVVVDEERIKSIDFVNLEESVTTMYPLATTAMEQIETQIIKNQSLENISYAGDSQYTSMVLMQAIEEALKKAENTKSTGNEENTENAESTEDAKSTENMGNTAGTEDTESMGNTTDTENTQNAEDTGDAAGTENTVGTENTAGIENTVDTENTAGTESTENTQNTEN